MKSLPSNQGHIAIRVVILSREMDEETWDDQPLFEGACAFGDGDAGVATEFEDFHEEMEKAVLEVVRRFLENGR